MKIKVWHGVGHDDSVIRPLEVRDLHLWISQTQRAGGFYTGELGAQNATFVPWHRINYVKQVEEQNNGTEEGNVAKNGQ